MAKEKNQLRITPTRKRKRKSILFVRPRKIAKVALPIVTNHRECIFCNLGEKSELGQFFSDEVAQIAAHQFCLFFSAGLPQKGDDSEGFDGFLIKDILKEKQRVITICCKICHLPGANSGCSVRSCRAAYHFKCGRNAGMQFNFTGAFDSYCKTHRSYQDLRLIKKLKSCPRCPVCLEDITTIDHNTILRTPCCRNVFLHKQCVQEQANASGYFFRCPTCNDTNKFPAEMVQYGIFTPSRDAAWETGNSYADQLEQYSKCDHVVCQSDEGRSYQTKSGKWNLLLCYVCGQSGVHVKCLGRRYIPGIGYVCVDCNAVVSMSKENVTKMQTQMESRLQEHKRRLQELQARNDPVLLASCVFGPEVLRKKFNVKPCHVVIEKIDHFSAQNILNITLTKPADVRVVTLEAGTSKVYTPKADTRKADTPKADTPKADTPKADNPKADTPKAVTPKADTPKADNPKAVTQKAVTQKADTQKADTQKADTPKADTPKAGTQKADTQKAVTQKAVTQKADTQKADTVKPAVRGSRRQTLRSRPNQPTRLLRSNYRANSI